MSAWLWLCRMGWCCGVVLGCAAPVMGQAVALDTDLPDPSRPIKLSVEDLCTLTVNEGRLAWITRLQGFRLISQPIEAPELPGTTTLTMRPRYFRLEHTFPSEGPNAGTTIRVYSRRSEDVFEVSTREYSAEYRQSEYGGARLNVYDSSYASVHNLSSDDFVAMRRDHPAAIIQYMGPLLRALRMPAAFGVEDRLAKRVLAAPRPAAQVRVKIEKLVGDLGAQSLQQRELAARQLRELGQDGYAALEKLDRWVLTPHQLTEIDAILNDAEGINAAQVAKLSKDPGFLLDCCYCEDAGLRAEAVRRLGEIAGADRVNIDPKADPLSQARAVEALRKVLVKPPATQPATQPAKPRDGGLLRELMAD